MQRYGIAACAPGRLSLALPRPPARLRGRAISARKRLRRLGLAGHTGLPSRMFAHALCVCERLTAVDFSSSLIGDDAIRQAAIDAPSHLAQLAERDRQVARRGQRVGVLRALHVPPGLQRLLERYKLSLTPRLIAPCGHIILRNTS